MNPIPKSAVREHVQRLADMRWDMSTIADAAQVPQRDAQALVDGKPDELSAADRRRLANLTPDRLLATRPTRVPAQLVRWKIGSLMAVGFDLDYQARRLGYNLSVLRALIYGKNGKKSTPVRRVALFFHNDVDTMWQLLADSRGTSLKAMNVAHRKQFGRPDEYAPDGTLWADLPAAEQARQRNADRFRAGVVCLETLRLSVRGNLTPSLIAARLSRQVGTPVDVSTVWLYREQARLAFNYRLCRGRSNSYWCDLNRHRSPRLAEVLAVVEEWESGPQADPVLLARKLGMLTASRYNQVEVAKVGVAA